MSTLYLPGSDKPPRTEQTEDRNGVISFGFEQFIGSEVIQPSEDHLPIKTFHSVQGGQHL